MPCSIDIALQQWFYHLSEGRNILVHDGKGQGLGRGASGQWQKGITCHAALLR